MNYTKPINAFGKVLDDPIYNYFFRDKNYIKPANDENGDHCLWYVHLTDVIDENVLSMVENWVDGKELFDAITLGQQYEGNSKNKIRETQMLWMASQDNFEELLPVYEYITDIIRSVNNDLWGYSVVGWEPFQYLEYKSENKGHFNWHIDIPARRLKGNQRKVSFMVGVSGDDEYEGGEIQLRLGMDDKSIKIGRGDVVVLPSFIVHRVTPVTKGLRRVVTGWGSGPDFT